MSHGNAEPENTWKTAAQMASPVLVPLPSPRSLRRLDRACGSSRIPLWDTDENAEVHKGQLIFSKSHSKFAWELVIRQWPAAARPNNWIINVLSVSCGWGLCLVSSGIIYSPDVPCGAIFTTISQMKRWSLPHLGITFQGAVVKCWAQEA